jgi:large subunit ribosomal protein L24
MKIKKGDTITILSGKDAGKTGKVDKVLIKKNKVVVTGLNLLKKNVKPSKKHPKGGIITIESPIHVSNVKLICLSCGKPTKVKTNKTKGQPKERMCKECGLSLDQGVSKK